MEMKTNMKKAIIFDLDGTLWDSTGQIYRIWNRVIARYSGGRVQLSRKDMERFMGRTMAEIGALLFPDAPGELQRKITEECGNAAIFYIKQHGAVLYPGLRETIRVLKEKHDLYIVSNCQDGYVNSFLSAHGFENDFSDIEMSGRTGKSKGDNIRLLMERNHIQDAVYVGDTESDEAAARFAGIPFVYAAYGFGTAGAPDRVIHDITELPDAVEEMG
jgi:phosphoglycolate phosphatase